MAESEPRYRFLHADGLKLALRRLPFFRASQVKPAVVSDTQLIGGRQLSRIFVSHDE